MTFPILPSNTANTAYNLTRSLRFRASASAYFSRTPATATNRKTWTWSGWVKRGQLGVRQGFFSCQNGAGNASLQFGFLDNDCFQMGNGTAYVFQSSALYRDPSSWYHCVVSVDTTLASNRGKIYINGSAITTWATNIFDSTFAQNSDTAINQTLIHYLGQIGSNLSYLDGYMAEVNFIDGQALTPSSFGSTNSTTGVWQPARYTGTYGTNGFYLPFTDNSALTTSSNVGLGKDFSGNGNYWTTNNISITAGVTYDSMTDVPTLTSATAANFAVLNPLDKNGTLQNGNLQSFDNVGASSAGSRSTIPMSSGGKYYAETTVGITTQASGGVKNVAFGFATSTAVITGGGTAANIWSILADGAGYIYANGTQIINTLGIFAAGTVLQIAFDGATGKAWVGKNNVWYNSTGGTTGDPATGANPTFTLTGTIFAFASAYQDYLDTNFGQRPLAYTPPTGFVALNTYNLPDSTIKQGNKVMDATLYTGTLLSNSVVNAAAFKPDLVWLKSRSAATGHEWTDSVRGVTKSLSSNSTAAEATDVQGLTAFNTNGFTVGTDTTYNNLAATYVAWQWQAGQGSSSSNTNGTITSTVSVNASAGFSVVTYTGNGTNGATIGHGLGITPSFVIGKNRGRAGVDWPVYHSSLSTNNNLFLDLTAVQTASPSLGWLGGVSSSTITLNIGATNGYQSNQSGDAYVAYCWSEIAGYSKFGSYTGNGSADGPFVYLGFRPKFILWKRIGTTTADWAIFDSSRDSYNVAGPYLNPNTSGSETSDSTVQMDLLSNGFKVRGTWQGENANGYDYMYAAFAENPFKNSLAR